MLHDTETCYINARHAITNSSNRSAFANLTSKAPSETSDYILPIVSLIGNVLSVVCLFALLLTYTIFKKHKQAAGKNIMCLSMSLIGAHILQILVIQFGDLKTPCIIFGVLLHLFLLSCFIWMLALAYDCFITFHKLELVSDVTKMSRFRFYCAIAVAVPTIIVLGCLASDIPEKRITQYGIDGHCFIVGFWTNLFAFVVPIGIILAVNLALMCYTVYDVAVLKRATRQVSSAGNRKQIVITFLALKIAILVGVAWIMAFIDGFIFNKIVKYIYTIIVTFQGFFIYLAFGCCKQLILFFRDQLMSRNTLSTRNVTLDTKL